MALDEDYITLDAAFNIAKNFYDKKTFVHAIRVLNFVSLNGAIPDCYKNDCRCLAVMHDLLEDTNYDPSDLPENFKKALKLLTKPDDMTYDDYCQRIHGYSWTDYGKCAWYVKLADMKDHLSQIKTLTPKLIEKYLSGLRYLL